jgi:DNA gyrase/topoisomerase IV subunit A
MCTFALPDGTGATASDTARLKTYRQETLRSVGKISEVRTSLIKKGFLEKLPKNKIRVNNFLVYQATVRQAEQIFRCIEQGIQPTEQNIRQNEQQDLTNLQGEIKNIADNFRVIGL